MKVNPMDAGADVGTIITAAGALLSAVTGALVWIYRQFHSMLLNRTGELEKKWEECEKKHAEAQDSQIQLMREISELKGRDQAYVRVSQDIQKLSELVLSSVSRGSSE